MNQIHKPSDSGILVVGVLTIIMIPLLYTLFTGKPKATHPDKSDSHGKNISL